MTQYLWGRNQGGLDINSTFSEELANCKWKADLKGKSILVLEKPKLAHITVTKLSNETFFKVNTPSFVEKLISTHLPCKRLRKRSYNFV